MMEDSNMSIDIVKAVETQDASALKTHVDSVLNSKAFSKLEDLKKDIASSLLDNKNEEDTTNEDV